MVKIILFRSSLPVYSSAYSEPAFSCTMRLIHNNNVSDPHINLALEEFCLRNPDMTEDYVLLGCDIQSGRG